MKDQVNVVSFVNKGYKRERILKPILIKMFLFTFMVTLAMILIYTDQQWAGFTIYAKEVAEFIIFIVFMTKRRKSGIS